MHSYLKNVLDGGRLSYEQGVEILKTLDWFEICQAGWEYRRQKVDEAYASYTMFRVINYTNVCTIDCKFCSFQAEPGSAQGYVLSKEDIFKKIDEALKAGADQIFFQGGVHPDLPLSYYTDVLKGVKEQYDIHIRGFSPVELLNLSKLSQMPLAEMLDLLRDAGLDSVPGAGAELLVERMRAAMSPQKCTNEEWCDVMEACHKHQLPGSATMVVGGGETLEEVVQHLDAIRAIQDRTQGFHAFIPWMYQQQTKRFKTQKIRSEEFLKILAFSRLYLDNITNIETSVMVLGKDLGRIALRVGANDISSVVIEENVLKSFGLRSEKEALKYLDEAGFTPRRRNFDYDYYPQAPQIQSAVA